MSYIGKASFNEVKNRKIQQGEGIVEDAINYVKNNKEDIAKKIYENKDKAFMYTSNAHRFYEKNSRGNTKPIRYLKEGEIHVPLHGFTGPGTRIDLPEVRNFKPYNNIDACSKTHDLAFEKLFKMPLGKERSEGIRKADKEALECYSKYPSEAGYQLAYNGINSKIALENISPMLFDKLMGQEYRGVASELKEEPVETVELGEIKKPTMPKEDCEFSSNKRRCYIIQRGGNIDPITAYLAAVGPVAAGLLYAEYRGGKYLYDRIMNKEEPPKT